MNVLVRDEIVSPQIIRFLAIDGGVQSYLKILYHGCLICSLCRLFTAVLQKFCWYRHAIMKEEWFDGDSWKNQSSVTKGKQPQEFKEVKT